MSYSGHKRSRDEDGGDARGSRRDGLPYEGIGSEQGAKKPRDWREAFLNDSDRKPHRQGSYELKQERQERRTEAHAIGETEDGEIEPSKPSRSQDHPRSKSRGNSAGADGHLKGGYNDVTKDVQPPVPIDVSKTVDALPQRKEEDAKTKSGQGESSHAAESTADTAFAADEPPDLEALLEERRRKRRELLERLAGTQSGVNSATPSSFEGSSGAQSTWTTAEIRESAAHLGLSTSNSGVDTHAQSSPPAEQRFELGKDEGKSANNLDILPAEIKADTLDGEAQISAADYNPDDDRKLDDERRKVHDIKAHATHSIEPPIRQEIADGLGEPATATANYDDEYEEVEEDVEDEDFDMFAVDEAPKKKRKVLKKKTLSGSMPVPAPVAATLVDNYDDSDGYYRITPGEILDNGRYKITVNLGKGMFAQVMRAKVLKASDDGEKAGQEVAIKVIRSQESMYIAGRKEAAILSRLVAADPDDKKHIVRLLRTFEHRGHFCLVTESLSMNLRDVIKRFGKDVGLNLRAVRAYAHQIFLALSLMKKCNVIHADLKPDNILVSENKAVLKVCDLGSACDAAEHDITPYLVSRFYRAPEIILGLPYDDSLDMWSIGCTLYELYTGKILFPGKSNNHMLHLMMDLKGKFTHRMIKKAQFGPMHFDDGMNFVSVATDKITGQDITKTIVISQATRDLKSRLMPPSNVQLRMKDEDLKLLTSFVDLLDKMLMLDPAKRIGVRDALLHSFLTG
ncbi:U4/U6 small nuclear ribonucleoprotein prp4, variant 3 [Naganishia albida]|nr:U4/U6 small nuclear ribonucleoprotein prp4, variant 3 [Naganishia albida]